jgi:hypothetical protein
MQMTTEALGNSSAGILAEDPQAARYQGLTALLDLVRSAAPDHSGRARGSRHAPEREIDLSARSEAQADASTGSHEHVHAHSQADVSGDEREREAAAPGGDRSSAEELGAASRLVDAASDLSSHVEEDVEAMVDELARALEFRRESFRGSAAADVFVFLKDASSVAFLSGYVIENGRRSVVRLVGLPATGPLDEHSLAATVNQEAGRYQWALPGRQRFHGLEREVPDGPLSMLYPRLGDAGTWRLRITEDAPAGDLEKRMRTRGLEATSKQLWDREVHPLYGEEHEWISQAASGRCLVLYQTEPGGLSPYHVGKQEIWLDAESLRLRKLVLVYRRRGDVGLTSWKQLVCVLFNDRRQDADALDGDPTAIREFLRLAPQQAAFVLEGPVR